MKFDPDKVYCHYTGFRKKCSANNARCPKWVFLQGTNPQTGEDTSIHACADSFEPLLLVDLKKAVVERGVGTQAAVEMLRNAVVPQNAELLHIARRGSSAILIDGEEEGPNGQGR